MANGENIDLHKRLVEVTSGDGTGSDISTLLIQVMGPEGAEDNRLLPCQESIPENVAGTVHILATLWNLIEDQDQGSSSRAT